MKLLGLNKFGLNLILLFGSWICDATIWSANSFLNMPGTASRNKNKEVDEYFVPEGTDSELPPEFLLSDSQEEDILEELIKADIRDTRSDEEESVDEVPGESETIGTSTEPNSGSHIEKAPKDPLGFGLFFQNSNSGGDDKEGESDAGAIVSIPNYTYSVCGDNTEEGIKTCEESCKSKVYNCVGKQCFCSELSEESETKPDEQLPMKSPFHVCGGNTYEGSLLCRRNCNLKKDLVVCGGKLCYCNLFNSTQEFLEPIENPNPKHPKRTDEIIFEELHPSPVKSQWDCYIGTDKETQVTRHETCINECSYMKEYNGPGGILLTCNNNNAICKCISFLPLNKQELQNLQDSNDHRIKVPEPPRKCRGFMCIIESYLTQAENEVRETLAETTVKNYVYCGPNSELGFTKCRDICSFEQAGVVRCGGFSCYCHYGSIPLLRNEIGKDGDGSDLSDKLGFPFRSRFIHCGKEKAECESVCQYIGEIVCGRLGCYCDSGL